MSTSPTVLSPREAAKYLGITQELLWDYVRYAPKSRDRRKLRYDPESKTFQVTELDEWDKYLREPWAEAVSKRPPVPTYIQSYLDAEVQGQCPLCGTGHKLENAHIKPYEETRAHHHHNLIRICTDCHSKYDDGIISREYIEKRKRELVAGIRKKISSEPDLILLYHTNLPLPDPFFFGRTDDLRTLQHLLETQRVVVIHGIGGIGKTQLAIHALSPQPRPVLWIDCESLGSLVDIQISLDRQLLNTNSGATSNLGLFEGFIVLDGFEKFLLSDWDSALAFVTNISETARRAKFVITSQTEIIGLHPPPTHLNVETLSQQDLQHLFDHILSQFDGRTKTVATDLGWLIRYADGHPFTARIMASLLEYFKDSAQVRQRIKEQGVQALRTPLRHKQTSSTALDICLHVAYDCFTHDQKRLLQYLSNFPGGCPLIRAKQWQDDADFDQNLAEIRRFDFGKVVPNQVLGYEVINLPNIVRQFVRGEWQTHDYEEAAEIQFDVAEELAYWAYYIIFEKLQGKATDELDWGLLLAEADLSNFLAAMGYAVWGSQQHGESKHPQKYLPLITQLGQLSTFFFMRSFIDYGIWFASSSAEANIKLERYDAAIEDLAMTARFQKRAYDHAGFTNSVEHLTEIAKKTNDSISLGIAEASLGFLASEERQYAHAVTHYKQALKYLKSQNERGTQHRVRVVLHDIGIAYEHLGEFSVALSYYRRNLRIQRETKAFGDLGSAFHHMANCYSCLGEQSKAIRYYLKAAKQFYRIGNGQYMNNSLSELGQSITHQDDIVPIRHLLTENFVVFALTSLRSETDVFIHNYSTTANYIVHNPLVPKIFNVVKLISFTRHVEMLAKWSNEFRLLLDDWLVAAREKYGALAKKKVPLDRRARTIFNMLWKINEMLLIANAISEGDIEGIEEMFDPMFDPEYGTYSEPEQDQLTPFQWLAIWKHFKTNPPK